MVWGGGALSLGVRTVPKGPIDRANKVSSSSLAPSRYSSTLRFERHPPLPHPTSPLPRRSATAAPPARSQMAGRAAGAPRAGTGCANLPSPIAIAFPARGGRPVGRGGGSAARVSSGLQPPAAGAPPPRAPSLHRRPELLTGARWPQVPAAGRRRLGASTSPSRGPRHALGSSRLVTLSTNLSPDFSCSHQPSPGRLPRCSGIVGGCWRGYTHPSYVGECPWA